MSEDWKEALEGASPNSEWLERWFQQGWDWDSLRQRPLRAGYFDTKLRTLGDYWDFIWNDLSLDNYGFKKEVVWEGKRWTPFHLPLFNRHGAPATGKHPAHPNSWSADERERFSAALRVIVKSGAQWQGGDRRAILNGSQIPPVGGLRAFEQTVYAAFDHCLFAPQVSFLSDQSYEHDKTNARALGAGCSIRGACFLGRAAFEGLSIELPFDARDTLFMQTADFWPTHFVRTSSYVRGFQPTIDVSTDEVSFADAHFLQSAWFNRAEFNGRTNFNGCRFEDDAEFQTVRFDGTTDFSRSRFLGAATFRQALFGSGYFSDQRPDTKKLAESGARAVIFDDVIFSERPDFSEANFAGFARLNDVTFGRGAVFRGTFFPSGASFVDCHFLDDANFSLGTSAADGSRQGTISGALIATERPRDDHEEVSLPSFEADLTANIGQELDAKKAGTLGPMTFSRCRFWGDLSFQDRIFGRQTSFSRSVIYLLPEFHGAQLHRDTDVSSLKLFPAFGPRKSDIPTLVPADKTSWRIVLRFNAVRIEANERRAERLLIEERLVDAERKRDEASAGGRSRNRASALAARTLSDVVEARRLDVDAEARLGAARIELQDDQSALLLQLQDEGRARLMRRATMAQKSPEQRTAKAGEFERAFQTLKTLMEDHRRRGEEQRFFALEVSSRLSRRTRFFGGQQEVTRAEWVFGRAYEVISDYGQSVFLPFAWLLLVAAFFGFVYTAWASEVCKGTGWQTALSITVRQLVPVFLVRDQNVAAESTGSACIQAISTSNPDMFALLAAVHAVLNVVLWFLFALALRRRYQIN